MARVVNVCILGGNIQSAARPPPAQSCGSSSHSAWWRSPARTGQTRGWSLGRRRTRWRGCRVCLAPDRESWRDYHRKRTPAYSGYWDPRRKQIVEACFSGNPHCNTAISGQLVWFISRSGQDGGSASAWPVTSVLCWSLSRFTDAEIFIESEAVLCPVPGASPRPLRGLRTDETLPADGPDPPGPVTGSRAGKEAAGRHVAMILWSQAGSPHAGHYDNY